MNTEAYLEAELRRYFPEAGVISPHYNEDQRTWEVMIAIPGQAHLSYSMYVDSDDDWFEFRPNRGPYTAVTIPFMPDTPTIFLLPSSSNRKYRGKYPDKVRSWGYSKSPSQMLIAQELKISQPVHLELNSGQRFIVDLREFEAMKVGSEFNPDPTHVCVMSPDVYNAMMDKIRALREGESR